MPLSKVLKHYDTLQPIIEYLVIESNTFVILGYMFINHYLLHLYLNKLPFPKIDINYFFTLLEHS